ncbi:hypothetical protein EPO15_07290 [bacterium]|nr:MAG: hypothetical protein EPO15_07290 [bacterium]
MTSVVLGGSGLVGGELLKVIGSATALVRRPLTAPAGVVVSVVDFANLPPGALSASDLYCCLGTTIAKAGGQAAFRAVDYDLPLALARKASSEGARRLFLVTANGANARSSVFYNRVKGELEEAVSALGFATVHILRPSLLLGARNESRPAEAVAQRLAPFLSPLMVGPLRRYRPIEAAAVARAMVALAAGSETGVRVHENERLLELADSVR